jgi:hypothetical protein
MAGFDGSYPVMARLRLHGPKQVVGIFTDRDRYDAAALRRLVVLDAETGAIDRSVELPNGAGYFPGFSDRFAVKIDAVDLDVDGVDEIIVAYTHDPYWPSYLVLFEPLVNRTRLLFLGSGHHSFAGSRDLDGDGRREILVFGVNNLMGWYNALGVVRVRPWINEGLENAANQVLSPDRNHSESAGADPLWYALLPSGQCVELVRCVDAGTGDEPIRIRLDDEKEVLLDRHGFVVGSNSRLSTGRDDSRRHAYRRLVEAERLRVLASSRMPWRRQRRRSSRPMRPETPISQSGPFARGPAYSRNPDRSSAPRPSSWR